MSVVVVASEFMGWGMGGWSKGGWGPVGGYLVRLLGMVRCIKWQLRRWRPAERMGGMGMSECKPMSSISACRRKHE